jgi:hypothetical protein
MCDYRYLASESLIVDNVREEMLLDNLERVWLMDSVEVRRHAAIAKLAEKEQEVPSRFASRRLISGF